MAYIWFLFDIDGTLFDYEAAETAALAATFSQFGHTLLPDHLEAYRKINGRMWLELERGATTQERLRVERFEALLKAVEIEADPVRFSDGYQEHIACRTELIDGAEEAVSALAEHARLMLITNGLAAVQRPRYAAAPISRFFEDIVISEEVGAAKPDRRIFEVAFEKMGRPKRSEVLMVGDSLSSDIRGGNEYGLDTCWFNPSAGPGNTEAEPTFEIRALSELTDLHAFS